MTETIKNFSGKVLFLDRNDINTDEIIPAKYLTEITKEALGPYLLEDLKLGNFDAQKDLEGVKVVVTRDNFGCGSSREHAPWALEVNNINLVIGEGFARIFRQNMYNCGMMAVELPKSDLDKLFAQFSGKETTVQTDVDTQQLVFSSPDCDDQSVSFNLSEFDKTLVKAGGWVEFADSLY
ncbi:MAG: 3-isopropylmalate dehydratase small subunit [Spirochaetales bacterium]|jgi:3-isopropylmalate/(R)-2-methylmalate dehydratase small subunit|nr:3-isopropylmalate dehydratase small subunit [Spirochaetales bacterium]